MKFYRGRDSTRQTFHCVVIEDSSGSRVEVPLNLCLSLASYLQSAVINPHIEPCFFEDL